MVADYSPIVCQRELGQRLRALRTGYNLSVEAVANEMMCSTAKISRLETGARKPGLRDVMDLCRLYQTDAATTEELMNLARRARELGWWAQYEDLGLYPYIGLEQDARSIDAYSLLYLHGLVQTEDYASAIIQATAPGVEPVILRQRVEIQLRRQELLEQASPPRYHLLIDEAALRRPMGNTAVMAAQIAKILELMDAGKVRIQLIPFAVGAYCVADIGFTALQFDVPIPSVVFVEGLAGNHYYERPEEVQRYYDSIEAMRDSGLSLRESSERLVAMQEAYATGQPLPP